MDWLIASNNSSIKLADIPFPSFNEFRSEIIDLCSSGFRVCAFFGHKVKNGVNIYAILSADDAPKLAISSSVLAEKSRYPSITPKIPSFHAFERELFEEFGLYPEGHPWLKPVRYSYNSTCGKMEDYPFFSMSGEEIHEVGVGPVHAGIIEPGHFRFMCNGERVFHLEIQLGYQHRGVETLLLDRPELKPNFRHHLAESIAGDSTIAHVTAYCSLIEALTGCETPPRARFIRTVAQELERAACHLGDLSALANDVAYLPASSFYGNFRTPLINTLQAICGNRFGKGLVCPGGVSFDLPKESIDKIGKTLADTLAGFNLISRDLFSSVTVLSRFEKTGIVDKPTADSIGLTGLAGRASGLARDIRTDHPYAYYSVKPIDTFTQASGDVFARAYQRFEEARASLQYLIMILPDWQEGGLVSSPGQINPDSLAVSLTEGWRGEVLHAAITDDAGRIVKYKVKDPSFCNWYGLALAVRNQEISDFPLCNKSFNLSYCGNDL
ncbi:MAG: NADH-quinone oxidoreductase subunit C [Candidatus Wallbacteria bacterium]|nr:NADH-quinone oxidoreductase subunit C [Candidatus Wallbacteria bacterium]